jgi:hypothetical protein
MSETRVLRVGLTMESVFALDPVKGEATAVHSFDVQN